MKRRKEERISLKYKGVSLFAWILISGAPGLVFADQNSKEDAKLRRQFCSSEMARIFEKVNPVRQTIEFTETSRRALKPRYLKAIENEIFSLNGILKDYFKIPEKVRIAASAYGVEAFHIANKIDAPMRLTYRFGTPSDSIWAPRSFDLSRAVIDHEYAHVLLTELLSARPKSPYARLRELSHLDPQTQANELEIEKLHQFIIPYEEFFADALAVLHLKDPAVIHKAISVRKRKNGYPVSERLDRLTQRRRFDVSSKIDPFEKEPHHTFDSLRNPIWEEFLNRPEVLNNPGPTLRKIAEAIDEEVTELYSQGNFKLSIREKNERFSKRLKSKLGSPY